MEIGGNGHFFDDQVPEADQELYEDDVDAEYPDVPPDFRPPAVHVEDQAGDQPTPPEVLTAHPQRHFINNMPSTK